MRTAGESRGIRSWEGDNEGIGESPCPPPPPTHRDRSVSVPVARAGSRPPSPTPTDPCSPTVPCPGATYGEDDGTAGEAAADTLEPPTAAEVADAPVAGPDRDLDLSRLDFFLARDLKACHCCTDHPSQRSHVTSPSHFLPLHLKQTGCGSVCRGDMNVPHLRPYKPGHCLIADLRGVSLPLSIA